MLIRLFVTEIFLESKHYSNAKCAAVRVNSNLAISAEVARLRKLECAR